MADDLTGRVAPAPGGRGIGLNVAPVQNRVSAQRPGGDQRPDGRAGREERPRPRARRHRRRRRTSASAKTHDRMVARDPSRHSGRSSCSSPTPGSPAATIRPPRATPAAGGTCLRGQRPRDVSPLSRRPSPMLARADGRIVIVGSGASYLPAPRQAGSVGATARAGLASAGFANTLAAEVGPEGLSSVFVISPGLVQTEMTSSTAGRDAPWTPPELAPQLIRVLASGRADRLAGRYLHAEQRRHRGTDRACRRDRGDDLNAIRVRR